MMAIVLQAQPFVVAVSEASQSSVNDYRLINDNMIMTITYCYNPEIV